MKVEVKAKNYSESDKGQTFVEKCTVIVKTTDDNGNTAETEEKGCIVHGEQMTFLNSEKVYLPNLPTEHQDIAGAFEEVLGKLQDGEGGDWQPPEWWIPVPEPELYEILILVWVTNTDNQFVFNLGNTSNLGILLLDANGNITEASINIDWGDGTTNIAPTGNYGHTFKEAGQYLVKITAQEGLNVFCSKDLRNCYWQIVKTGSRILYKIDTVTVGYGTPLSNHNRLKYIKINNTNGLPLDKTNYYFEYDYALQKIELKKPMAGNVPNGCFRGNPFTDLQQILDGNSVNAIGDYAFTDCRSLRKIILPNCTSVGDYAFQNCYNLQEIVVADNCTFGKDCFQGCYSLYPRPDGSTN